MKKKKDVPTLNPEKRPVMLATRELMLCMYMFMLSIKKKSICLCVCINNKISNLYIQLIMF